MQSYMFLIVKESMTLYLHMVNDTSKTYLLYCGI